MSTNQTYPSHIIPIQQFETDLLRSLLSSQNGTLPDHKIPYTYPRALLTICLQQNPSYPTDFSSLAEYLNTATRNGIHVTFVQVKHSRCVAELTFCITKEVWRCLEKRSGVYGFRGWVEEGEEEMLVQKVVRSMPETAEEAVAKVMARKRSSPDIPVKVPMERRLETIAEEAV